MRGGRNSLPSITLLYLQVVRGPMGRLAPGGKVCRAAGLGVRKEVPVRGEGVLRDVGLMTVIWVRL